LRYAERRYYPKANETNYFVTFLARYAGFITKCKKLEAKMFKMKYLTPCDESLRNQQKE
jgi:hypothetical protein